MQGVYPSKPLTLRQPTLEHVQHKWEEGLPSAVTHGGMSRVMKKGALDFV